MPFCVPSYSRGIGGQVVYSVTTSGNFGWATKKTGRSKTAVYHHLYDLRHYDWLSSTPRARLDLTSTVAC